MLHISTKRLSMLWLSDVMIKYCATFAVSIRINYIICDIKMILILCQPPGSLLGMGDMFVVSFQ